ncbi:MAG: ribbon-helix-helix protein, CopG family [Pleurocapsa sp. SU_196_0]|nr:ribbon-helix-helix protein, CopG family [Pleurocapsa sp. SU_196_0]
MKTVQMLVEESLLARVDTLAREADTTRSEFIREALHREIKRREVERLEAAYRQSYEHEPASTDESWNPKRAWGEA